MKRFRAATATGIVLTLFGITIAGSGYFQIQRMTKLQTQGIPGTAVITNLNAVETGTRDSRSTSYRVHMELHDNSVRYQLTDDVAEKMWGTLARGDSIDVIYVPDEKNICVIGDHQTVENLSGISHWFVYVGLLGFAIGVATLIVDRTFGGLAFSQSTTQQFDEAPAVP